MKAPVTLVVALLMLVPPALVTTAAGTTTPKGAPLPSSAPVPKRDVIVDHSVHDVSAPLRDIGQPAAARATVNSASAAPASTAGGATAQAGSRAEASAATCEPAPDCGAVEQTSPGTRPALGTVADFDVPDMNGGSTSDNNIGAGPDSLVTMRNSKFEVLTKSGQVTFGPVNNNSIFAGTNTIQQVALNGYATDGDSYRLNYNGAQSVPITRGQNDTQAGIQAAIQGGNEQQQVNLSGYTGTNSYTLNYGGVDSAPFVRGTNDTASAVTTALNGASEVQTVGLSNYDANGDSYVLRYQNHKSAPIVRGQNDTPAGVQNALQGGNEVQQISFSNFNSANPGNDFRVEIGGRLSDPLGYAAQLGEATPITAQNISDEINAIFGFPGTVTVTDASDSGFTVSFGGASANKDVPAIGIVFADCASASTPCTSTNREVAKGGTAMTGWPAGGTVTAGATTDSGYTLTFGGSGFQGSDVSGLAVTNGTGGTTGTVAETVKGAKGLLPVGAVATVGTVADSGYTVTFGGTLANTAADVLRVTNGTGGTTGTVRETVKGSPGFAGWIPGTTVSVSTPGDSGYTVTFNALSTLGSATQTGLGDVSPISVTAATSGVTGTVTKTQHGAAGIGQGRCTNSGDGHIRYDQLANRWLFTTPTFTRVGGLYAMCYAVSVTSNATGPYNRYVFTRSLFPDYPRVTVWPDGYYNATSTGDTVIEKHACAVNRTAMLQGQDATEQCFIVPGSAFMEPSDLEGNTLPPAGEPNHYFAAGGSQLRGNFEADAIFSYKFHVDWNKPLNSTFTGPTTIQVSPYHFLCNGQLTECVPQPGSTVRLDSQGDKLMHSVVYRNVNGVQSFVMLHSINTAVGAGGERWYEMRLDANDNPVLYQQSTYAPDDHYRWLGSPNMDRKGDIALAYSFGGGPYIPPVSTTLAVPSAAGDTNIKVGAIGSPDANFSPGGKIDIDTGASVETATVRAVGTPATTTTLSTPTVAGDTNIKVASVANISVGDQLALDTGANQEIVTVTSVGTAGATGTGLGITPALQRAHASGSRGAAVVDLSKPGTGVDLTAPLSLPHASGSPVSNAAYSCVQPACLPVGQRFTARQPGDPLGEMTYQEGVIVNGVTAAGGSRWEDWSKLALDPSDDCTFWYLGGYGNSAVSGGPYLGRVGAFRLPSCRLDATGRSQTLTRNTAFHGPVASFTDSDSSATAGSFTARVDWGDGTSSPGVISGSSGSFTVTSSHTYTAAGSYTVTTSVTGNDGSVATATTSVTVR